LGKRLLVEAEQFRITNNGRGYKVYKSVNVEAWISRQSYQRIAFQKPKKGMQYMETEMWLDDDGVYARSAIHAGHDNDYNREVYTSHTILIRYKDLARKAIGELKFEGVLDAGFDEKNKMLPTLQL
jgi:hypothetical protein